MTSHLPAPVPERYELENGRYTLYLDHVRLLSTDIVAVLIDTRLPMLITHGDPASVRRELDDMRGVPSASRAPRPELDWLLLEGRPDVHWLNRALVHPGAVADIDHAFRHRAALGVQDIARSLLERLARSG